MLISAGTLAEALIVSTQRNVGHEVASLITGLGFQVMSVTPASARRMWDDLRFDTDPIITAVSTLTIVLTCLLLGSAHLLRSRTAA